jgi:VanZ family protein
MSATPMPFPSRHTTKAELIRLAWLPVLFTLIFIRFTSTSFMGGSHTQVLVDTVWQTLFGNWHWDITGPVNEFCRKTGHFFGYGLISLIFRNAWYRSAKAFAWVIKTWLTPFASSLAIASTFFIACLDEWHQCFVPGRVGSLRDALIDTAGALLLNVFVWEFRAYKRRKALNARSPIGT